MRSFLDWLRLFKICSCILAGFWVLSARLFVGAWRSLVAHLHGVQGVAGSNPAVPILYRAIFSNY
jgi:hypothetical protein